MSKFKVGQNVVSKENGRVGVIKAREVVSNDVNNEKFTTVKYMVDFGDGIENWKVVEKKDLENYIRPTKDNNAWEVRGYAVGDGKSVTIAALVENNKVYDFIPVNGCFRETIDFVRKERILSIGYSIYNGTDEYNKELGVKIAKHRAKHEPFSQMTSPFGGEFNKRTVVSIMNAKADYILENFDKFFNPEK